MIRATQRQAGGLIALLASCLLGSWGCRPSPAGTEKKPPTLNVQGAAATSGKQAGKDQAAEKPQPQEFVGNFLKALGEGSAAPEQLTPAFRKKIARPEFKDEAQQKLGYNPRKVEEFLAKAGAGNPEKVLKSGTSAAGPYFYGRAQTTNGQLESYLIRLVPAAVPGGWQVDWFQRCAVKGPSAAQDDPGPERVGAQLAAHEFLENLLGSDLTLAEAAMSNSWKSDLAWSVSDSNKDQGYDSKLLQQRLKDWKNGFTEFTIDKRDFPSGAPAVFQGVLLGDGRQEKKRFVLQVMQAAGGEWLVADFSIH